MKQIYEINNNKFKSVFLSLNYTSSVTKKELSEIAVLASMLSKSSAKYKDQSEIERFLFECYGASFDVNVQKVGDLYDLEFKIEFVNKKYLPNNSDMLNKCLDFLFNIIYNPNMSNGKFIEENVIREKTSMIEKVNQRKDNKIVYSIGKMEEILCKDHVSGYYIFGDEEIIKNITNEDLVKRYNELLKNSSISLIISGNLDGYENIKENINNVFGNKLESILSNNELVVDENRYVKQSEDIEQVEEHMETSQSVITYGLKVLNASSQDFYAISMYNAILATTPSSKLFRIFREKESLAYIVNSRFYRFKNMIIIYAGIQKSDYERAKKVLNEQLLEIQNGNISDEEFSAAKDNLLSNLKEWEDSKVAIAKMFFSNIFAFDNENVTIEQMYEKMNKITKQDVVNIANRIKLEKIYFLGGNDNV